LDKIIQIVSGVVGNSKFWDLFKGKERLKNEFLQELAKNLHDANFRQTEINKIEASHQNIFVSGWRPFIGWVCGSALAYQFILRDFLAYSMRLFGSSAELPPSLDISQLISILLAMLGMAGYRTFEKLKDKA
jgi:hypothetical protein